MQIEKIHGFKFGSISGSRRCLLIESSRIKQTIEFIKKEKIKCIELNSQWGYKIKNIDFVTEVADIIEDISVIDDEINLKNIELVSNLKYIFIGGENKYPIDFSCFTKIERCNIFWHSGLKKLNTCKSLNELVLRKYVHNDKNFQSIYQLANLAKLNFLQSKFTDLNFLKYFPVLEEFEIYYINSLLDISGLKYVISSLKKLIIEHCKKIESYNSIKDLKHLSYLGINDSASISSLNILKKMGALKHFSFVGTNVSDGDLAPCVGINYVGFNNKKHYSHKFEEINQKGKPVS